MFIPTRSAQNTMQPTIPSVGYHRVLVYANCHANLATDYARQPYRPNCLGRGCFPGPANLHYRACRHDSMACYYYGHNTDCRLDHLQCTENSVVLVLSFQFEIERNNECSGLPIFRHLTVAASGRTPVLACCPSPELLTVA